MRVPLGPSRPDAKSVRPASLVHARGGRSVFRFAVVVHDSCPRLLVHLRAFLLVKGCRVHLQQLMVK